MSDHPFDELAALKDLIPPTLDPEVLASWKRTGMTVLTERGLYSEDELKGNVSAEDFSALDRLDARAQVELVAAIIVAAGNQARRRA